MKLFSKSETVAVLVILFFVAFVSFFNYKQALLRGRDNERKNDLSDIKNGLENYHAKYNVYPQTLDSLSEFMKVLPKDPSTPSGRSYLYLSDGHFFQIFASLEDKNDSEYNFAIDRRGLRCGNFICNFGKSDGQTPLDKTLQEYENELYAKKKKK